MSRCFHRLKSTTAFLLLGLSLLVRADVASAATFTVTNTNDSGAGSLRKAILDSTGATADTIVFSFAVAGPKTINLASALPNITNDLTISAPALTSITIRRNTGNYGILRVDNGSVVTMQGLTFSNGSAINDRDSGGAIFVDASTLTLEDCTFSDNSAVYDGGAISNSAGNLTLTDCTFTNNFTNGSSGTGGAIENVNGTVNATNCTFSGNSVGGSFSSGGAFSSTAGTVTLTGCTFSDNSADTSGNGGAISLSGGTVNVSGSSLSSNSAASSGGAIYNTNGTLTLTDCTLSGNSVTNNGGIGGAIYNAKTLTITGSTLSGNISGGDGGAIYNTGGTVNLTSSTLSGNISTTEAGAIRNLNGTVTINNSTLSGNAANGNGGAIRTDSTTGLTNLIIDSSTIAFNRADADGSSGSGGGIFSVSTTSITLRNTILAKNERGSAGIGVPDNLVKIGGTVTSNGHNLSDTAPAEFIAAGDKKNTDPLLDVLADNDGTTQTHALLAGSPALDAGDTLLTLDQRAMTRPQGSSDDIGAFELEVPLSLSINDVAVTEGNPNAGGTTNAVFTVTLSGPSTDTVTVKYTTDVSGGYAATAGEDYTSVPLTTLTFTPGQTTQTITVLVTRDSLDEYDELFKVRLSSPTNAIIADSSSVGTITNDDVAPSLNVEDVTVSESVAGNTNAVFTLTLSQPSGRLVALKYLTGVTAGYVATAGADYTVLPTTVLTIPAGQTSIQVVVPILEDALDEYDERFILRLNSPTNATLARTSAVGIITDNDAEPSLSINNVTQAEGNPAQGAPGTTAFTFTISLSAVSGRSVVMKYSTAKAGANAATAGTDYVSVLATVLTIDAGQTSKQVTISVNGDTDIEAAEDFLVKLTSQTNATLLDAEGTGTITNDDVSAPLLDEPSQ